MSRGVLAWPVDIDPSWPVFIAWSMSSASAPRHSPTMIRSGRMRSELRTSSRIGTAPLPSMLAGRDSSVTTCSWRSCSSAASSTVTMRSSFGMNDERTLSIVVLPEPVPPETKTLRRASTHARRKSNISGVEVPKRIRSSVVSGVAANFRMVSTGPTRLIGGMITLTREPSTRRASTIGLDSSTRRPMGEMMRSMMRITCSSFWKVTLVSSILPRALDVDLARAVDHDLGHAVVAQQRLERSEADDLVGDLLEHARALGTRERQALAVERAAESLLDLAPHLDLVGQVELRVEVGDDSLLDAELGVAEGLAQRNLGEHPAARSHRRHSSLDWAGRGDRRGQPWPGRAPSCDALTRRLGGPARPRGSWTRSRRAGHQSAAGRALSIRRSSDIRLLTPLLSARAIGTGPCLARRSHRRAPRAASASSAPRTCLAMRTTSSLTFVWRDATTNGTPRLRAKTTVRPSETTLWLIFRPIELSTSWWRMP